MRNLAAALVTPTADLNASLRDRRAAPAPFTLHLTEVDMQSKLTFGMDIGKNEVVVACHEGAFAILKMANAVAGLRRWLGSVPAGSRLGLEATGGYHERWRNSRTRWDLPFTYSIPRTCTSTRVHWGRVARPTGWMHRSLPLTWPNTACACIRSCP